MNPKGAPGSKLLCSGKATVMMMDGSGMATMMAWMMGLGLLGWVLIIALVVTLIIALVQLFAERRAGHRRHDAAGRAGRLEPPS